MVMETVQIRMSKGLMDHLDTIVDQGLYANRSDAIRDAVRRFIWEREVGSAPGKGPSVKDVQKARVTLSREPLDLDTINTL